MDAVRVDSLRVESLPFTGRRRARRRLRAKPLLFFYFAGGLVTVNSAFALPNLVSAPSDTLFLHIGST
ncbi:hypothetical protein FB005_14719 [Sinorhizobium medicae]|nr:hypothetical protein FB006_1491 [Sinorhizobium medicae]TWA33457.1 hypothetical protein FB005_14719 [Sinorhizobium medicae]